MNMPHDIHKNYLTKAMQEDTTFRGILWLEVTKYKSVSKHLFLLMYLSYSSFNFDIISLSTAGIGGPTIASKHRKIFNYVKKHSSPNGIMFLQETHSTEKVETIWTNQWGCGKGAIHFSHGKSDSRGVLIAFREGLDYNIDSVFRDNDRRYLIIQTKIQDEPFIPVNYYAPNEEGAQIPVLSKINEIIQNLETEEDTTTI